MENLSLDQSVDDSLQINFKEQSHISNKPYMQLTKEQMYLNTKFFEGENSNQKNLMDEFMNFDFEKQMTTKTQFTQFTQKNKHNETVSSIINQKEVYEESEQESLWQDIFIDNQKKINHNNMQFDIGQLQQQDTSYISQSLHQQIDNYIPHNSHSQIDQNEEIIQEDQEDVIIKQESFVVDDLEQIIFELKREQNNSDKSQKLQQKEKIENFYSNFLSQHKHKTNLKNHENNEQKNFQTIKDQQEQPEIHNNIEYNHNDKILDKLQRRFSQQKQCFKKEKISESIQLQNEIILHQQKSQNFFDEDEDQIRPIQKLQPEFIEKPKSKDKKFIPQNILQEEERFSVPQQFLLTEDQQFNLIRKQKKNKIQIKTVKKDNQEIQNLKKQQETLKQDLKQLDNEIQENEKKIFLLQIQSEKLLPQILNNFESGNLINNRYKYPSEIMLQRPQTPSLFIDQNAMQQYFGQDSSQSQNSLIKDDVILKNLFKNQNLQKQINTKEQKPQKKTQRKLNFDIKEKEANQNQQKSKIQIQKKNDNFITFSQKQLQNKCNKKEKCQEKIEEKSQSKEDSLQQDSSRNSTEELYNFDGFYNVQQNYQQEKEITIQKPTTKDIQFKAKYKCSSSSIQQSDSEQEIQQDMYESKNKVKSVKKIKQKNKSPQKQDKIFEYIRKKIIDF